MMEWKLQSGNNLKLQKDVRFLFRIKHKVIVDQQG